MAASTSANTRNHSLDTMTSPFDNMDAASPDFLKMEDFDHSTHDDSGVDFSTAATPQSTQTSPPPVIVTSKPAKKRKSWGQQLPEPKTTLPPRKRAKTDDEKEQRRIERIKRNRAAAHNSRERKRQEAEVLAVENAKLRTKLDAFEKHFGPLPKHIVLPEVTLCTDDADTPAPSLIESRGSIATATSPASPPDLYDFTTNDMAIKQEPHDSPYEDLCHDFPNLDGKQPMPTFAPLDETQHSAAMLCDLPCPSSRCTSPLVAPSNPLPLPSNTTVPSLIILRALHTSFLLTYKTLMLAIWQTRSPSRLPARAATSASRPASTSPSTTSSTPTGSRTRPQRSPEATALAQRNAATASPRSAALRRPLVGEARRTVDLTMAARRRRGSTLYVRGEARERASGDGEQRDHDRGVRRRDG